MGFPMHNEDEAYEALQRGTLVDPASPEGMTTRALRSVTSTRHKVLWVEDDPDLVALANEYFSDRGFDVIFTPDGVRALEELRSQEFDAVVLDLDLPRMSGLKFLHHARMIEDLPQIPILVVSGAESDYAARARHMGAVSVFRKPVRLRQLARSLREAITFIAIRP